VLEKVMNLSSMDKDKKEDIEVLETTLAGMKKILTGLAE
jgi:hypothetical protein